MPSQELIFAIRAGDVTKIADFASSLQSQAGQLAAGMGVEVLGYEIADTWEPPAAPPHPQLAFGNNRVLDSRIPPNTDDEF